MRVKLDLKKLKDAEPKFVSLVRRSANQIPFRIQKAAGEDNMGIDLAGLSRVMKGEKPPKTARVAALVVKKSDDMEPVLKSITDNGYSVDKPTENADGTILFAQEDNAEKDARLIRMSEDLVLVMKGFEPWEAEITSFAEQVGLEGYYSGLYTATSALSSLFGTCVREAETHDEMVSAVKKALSDFDAYVLGIAQAIPASCYPVDASLQLIQKAAKTDVCKECGGGMKDKQMMHKAGCKTNVKKDETAPVTEPNKENTVAEATPVTPAVEPKKEEVVKTDPPAPVAEVKTDPMAQILAAISGVTTQLEAVVKAQASQGERIEAVAKELGAKVAEVVQKADATEEKLKTVVPAPAKDGDEPAKVTVTKAEEELGAGYWDSALARRRK
jgi:hypothetical protein